MNTPDISGVHGAPHYGFTQPSREKGDAVPLPSDTFTAGSVEGNTAGKARFFSASPCNVLLDNEVRPAFSLDLKWEIPCRSGISPQPNVGLNGEVNISTFGSVRIAKEGKTILEVNFEDPHAKYPGYRTKSVSQAPAFSDDGVAYVPDRSGFLTAFDLKTGEKLWEYNTKNHEEATSPVLTPGGKVVFRDGSGNLIALSRTTGKKAWDMNKWAFAFKADHRCIPPPKNHPPVLAPDGTLYVTGKKGTIYAVDSATGKYKKGFESYDAGEALQYSFTPVADNGGRLFLPQRGEKDPQWKVVCLDGSTGKKLWETPAGDNVCQPVVGPDGTLYIGTTGATWITRDNPGENQKVMALDPETGKSKWEIPIAGRIEGIALDPSGRKLAVSHSRTIFIEQWEEIESRDSLSIIDTSTRVMRCNVKGEPKSEEEGIHSISFLPDGNLLVYGYPDTVRAYAINDQNLFLDREGKVLTAEDINRLPQTGGSEADGEKGIEVGEETINIDGVKLARKNGRFQKL